MQTYGKPMVVGASLFGGPGDPGTGHVGYRGDDLRGTASYAELGMGTLLGNLPYGTPLLIVYKGRSEVSYKRDIGLGGSNVKGKRRAIDLWYEDAQRLGFGNGLDLVTVYRIVPGTVPPAKNAGPPLTAKGTAAAGTANSGFSGASVLGDVAGGIAGGLLGAPGQLFAGSPGSNPINTAVDTLSIPGKFLALLTKFWNVITDPDFWLRAGKTILGGILIMLALALFGARFISGVSKPIRQATRNLHGKQ